MLHKFSTGSVRLCRNDARHCCCISEHGKLGIEDKNSRPSGELGRLDTSAIPRGPTYSRSVICWSAHNCSCVEGKAMTRKIWVLVMVNVLVSVILLKGQVFATDADGRKKIVVFLDDTSLADQQTVVAQSGSTMVQPLLF